MTYREYSHAIEVNKSIRARVVASHNERMKVIDANIKRLTEQRDNAESIAAAAHFRTPRAFQLSDCDFDVVEALVVSAMVSA